MFKLKINSKKMEKNYFYQNGNVFLIKKYQNLERKTYIEKIKKKIKKKRNKFFHI